MLRAGLVDSVSCNVVSIWRPCFVRVLSTVCRVMLCLSGDHARAGLVDSVSCNVVSVW